MEKTLKFELASDQLKLRNILDKDFIELEVYAISDVDPNRNGSHFTLDSLKDAIDSDNLKNKPIVGFFEKNDFTTHEGRVKIDTEIDKRYWDTTNGERILGWIRESDPVEIVEVDGIHWIRFRCMLCVTYCYAQVKRLLKDKRKKVSVEIDVLESRIRDDGVEDIIKFNLNGTTILGSKFGKEILEGIQGAHASILESLDDDMMNAQREALTFAYAQMDCQDDDASKNQRKEESMEMEENKDVTTAAGEENANFEATADNTTTADAAVAAADAQFACDGEQNATCGDGENASTACVADNQSADGNCPDCGEGSCDDKDKDEEMCKMSARISELEAQCQVYCYTIQEKDSVISEYEAKMAQFSDYDSIKERMTTAENKLHEYFCSSLKQIAVKLMETEKINSEHYDSIIKKCENGDYANEEDIKRDVAYAAYVSRPVSSQSFSMPITEPGSSLSESSNMSRAERIAARNKHSN